MKDEIKEILEFKEDTTINIQDLFNERIEQNKRIEELCLEIERLNNIITELEKWLEENDKQLCLRKLKELKEDK